MSTWHSLVRRARGDDVEYTVPNEPRYRLARHAKFGLRVRVKAGKVALMATATRVSSGVATVSDVAVIVIVDDALEEATAACRSCNGLWGPQGIHQAVGCNCRTRDSGKVCVDGLECEGDCRSNGRQVVVDHKGPNGRSRGYHEGRCSEFVADFGCHANIPEAASVGEPGTFLSRRFSRPVSTEASRWPASKLGPVPSF
jgi:hypothetical protein